MFALFVHKIFNNILWIETRIFILIFVTKDSSNDFVTKDSSN